MGVYIRGMEMPAEEERGKCIVVRPDGEVWIVEFDNLIAGGYVCCYPTNPMRAVPVPPHGRLVDETYLNMQIHTAKEIHANEKREFCNAFDSNGCVCTEWWCVEDMIDNAPTVIPPEEESND